MKKKSIPRIKLDILKLCGINTRDKKNKGYFFTRRELLAIYLQLLINKQGEK